MKNKIYTIFLLGLSLLLLSTCKNPEIGYETFTITDESIEPEVYGAKVNGSFSFSGNVQEIKMKIATDESLTDATDYSTIIDNQTFSAEIEGLEPNTTYYYCYSINFGWKDDYLTDINSFTTLKGFPTVKTLEIIALYDASFRIKCEVTSDGGSDIMERGLYWNNVGNPNLDDNKIIHDESGVGEYVCLMDNLEPNTTYYVRAYAKNDTGIGLAQEVLRFETQDHPNDSLTIVTDCNPPDGGSATGGGTFASGQRCTVTTTANEGYAFTRWTENGNQVSTEASYTFTVTSNRTLIANFEEQAPDTYYINVSPNPNNGGTVTGGGNYQQGQSCRVTATAATGYTFTNWTENGIVVSTNADYTFTVNANRTLVANFTINTYTINASANPSNGGNVTGGGSFNYGESCTLTATAANGYTFDHWTKDGTTITGGATINFTVTANATYVAYFTGGDAPTGAINGKFTINPNGDQVYFSKGNLQYIGSASNPYWKFADNQWDYLGDNGQGSESQQADRDLFGWGTSGNNHGAICYQPWSTSDMASDYNAYGDPIYDLNNKTGEADWGYNSISNGGNMTNEWHTLTTDEWVYVINKRTTPSGILYAKAIVHDINGVILLPDDWMDTDYDLHSPNTFNADFSTNQIRDEQWRDLEQKGAVFLPAAGSRSKTYIYYGDGNYWSASVATTNTDYVCHVGFNSVYFNPGTNSTRCHGFSVRLVFYVK
jgi:hypothetical protein